MIVLVNGFIDCRKEFGCPFALVNRGYVQTTFKPDGIRKSCIQNGLVIQADVSPFLVAHALHGRGLSRALAPQPGQPERSN